MAARLRLLRAQSPDQPHTVAELVTRYQKEYLSTQARTTQVSMATIHARIVKDFGSWPLGAVTPEALRGWRDRLAGRYKPGTVRRFLDGFSGLFRVAVRDLEWLEANPLRKVKKPAEPPGRERFLTQDEAEQLLLACQQSGQKTLHLFVVLALSTGCRKMELMTLRWSGVNLEAGTLMLARTKNGTARSVPVTGLALRLLREHAERAAARGFVFPGEGQGHAVVDRPFKLAVKRAGLANLRVHDLRHTFASQVAMSGASTTEVAELLGHKQIKMAQKYSHFTKSHLGHVAAKMTRQFLGE